MPISLIDQIAETVLYEGYLLYPYRPAVKNSQRWTFGGLYPPAYCADATGNESAAMQVQCLVEGEEHTAVQVTLRFLQLVDRRIGRLEGSPAAAADLSKARYTLVDHLDVNGQELYSWQEAIEQQVVLCRFSLHESAHIHGAEGDRERYFRGAKSDNGHSRFALGELAAEPYRMEFAFASERQIEPVHDERQRVAAVIVRERHALTGALEVAAEKVAPAGFRLTVRAVNETTCDPPTCTGDGAQLRSFASAHLVLAAEGGQFVSQIDPPETWRALAAENHNVGAWPVLVGEPPRCNLLLAAPIILYDYPQIAPQSPGGLFDSTEIDEILTLRIMTLSDEEKRAMDSLDVRGSELLRRVESLSPEAMLQLHGKM